MIIASAIKCEIKGNQVVLCGVRHGDIFKQMQLLGFSPDDVEEAEQGFVDNHNNFLDRLQAFEHAKNCGQLCARLIHDKTESGLKSLISEDLW